MPLRIRLARKGRKSHPIYSIIAADGRAPRDGKFIEKLGQYDPNTNPATIELNFDRALHWLQNGAQPSDTARAILSYKGVLMKKHLLEGVKKGAFDEAAADEKFNQWMADKSSKIQAKVDNLSAAANADLKAKLDAEIKVNEDRSAAIAEKSAVLAKEAEAAVKAETEAKEAEEAAKVEAETEAREAEKATKVEVEAKTEEVVEEAKTEEVVEEKPAEEEKKAE